MVAREIIKNASRDKPLNRGQILEKAGYAKTTQRVDTNKVFTSDGVKQALIAAGATSELLGKVVTEAMEAKQGQWFHGEYKQNDAPDHRIRLNAASLLGDFVGAKKMVVESHNINVNMSSDELREMLSL